MKKDFIFMILASFFFSLLQICSNCFALEKETHRALNQQIARMPINSFSLNAYVANQLGFSSGVVKVLDGKEIWKWVRDGGEYEDDPAYSRSLNHFHDPLTAWDSAGFKGTFKSSVIWSQDQGDFGSLWGGDFSWKTVREYFYIALTGRDFSGNLVAFTQPYKEKYFGKTFRGIGQVMHLVQDASVPAHTRNDAHVIGYHYELAVDKMRANGDPVFTNAAASPIPFDPSILTLTPNPLAPIPIAKIFDADKYDPANPDPAVTIGHAVGVSEYSNANFFSESTIFRDYPHPAKENTTGGLVEQSAKDGKTDKVWYIQGYTSERLAAYSYLNKWLSTDNWEYNLDDYVYEDYASQLIPRAVGYSAGLLDYFFRGNIEIALPSSGVYSATDSTSGFTRVTLLAKNTTVANEDMTNGSITLVVKYKLALEDPFQSYPVPVADEFSYIVAPVANGVTTIPRDSFVELAFDLPQNNPIPLYATNIYLQVVFRGTLGNEVDAVAVGFKDISEPTPVDLYNNMDKICINGTWYDAGSAEAIAQVDSNQDGIPEWDIYPHNMSAIYLKVSPANNAKDASALEYTFATPSLAAGGFYRAYILSDNELNRSESVTVVKTTPSDVFTHASETIRMTQSGRAIKNQTDYVEQQDECSAIGATAPCEIRHYPLFYPFRGVNMWGPAGFILDNPKYPFDANCPWDMLN